MLVVVLALDGILALLFASAPSGMGPMSFDSPSLIGLPLGLLIAAIGSAIHLVGLAWMVRIIRADPEAHASWWRFDRS